MGLQHDSIVTVVKLTQWIVKSEMRLNKTTEFIKSLREEI